MPHGTEPLARGAGLTCAVASHDNPACKTGGLPYQHCKGRTSSLPIRPLAPHDFLGCTITTILRRLRDRIGFHLAPAQSDGNGRLPAGAVKCASFRKAGNRGYDIRPIAIGTEGYQVSRQTPRAFYAMANTVAHENVSSQIERGHGVLSGIAQKSTAPARTDRLTDHLALVVNAPGDARGGPKRDHRQRAH